MDETSPASAPQMRFGKIDDLSSRVAVGIDAARKYLFSQQHEDGYWCGELEADSTLESDYIVLHTLLGTEQNPRVPKAAKYILEHQNEDGGWSIYSGGPTNLSASVKAYFGLKLAGYKADHPALARAREVIREQRFTAWANEVTTRMRELDEVGNDAPAKYSLIFSMVVSPIFFGYCTTSALRSRAARRLPSWARPVPVSPYWWTRYRPPSAGGWGPTCSGQGRTPP